TRPLILVVDDSPSICQILKKILTENGYRFIAVQNSFQALPMILKHKPDLVLLDLAMPVANGYEVCAQIRRVSTFQSLPIVIVSGNDGMVDRVRARLVGATGFLSKPFRPQEVLETAGQYLNISS
ncbi:MAG: response regulator, partial [Merismopedia sp. SIO2A8]|nr:response regulator [Merismopedia sp. SIO2A8]